MTLNIKKAVIPVAGLGTRFLPVTKGVPKELLPVVTTPTIHLVVKEAIDSGLNEVVFVTSRYKPSLVEYFKKDTEYTRALARLGKQKLLDELNKISDNIKISSVFQDEQKGLGHAVLCAKNQIGNEPFLVILPDVLIESKTPCCKQLMDIFNRIGMAVNTTEHSPKEKLHLYGIYDILKSEGKIHYAKGVVEKPKTGTAPSDLSVVGRYLFPPEVFDILEKLPPGTNGEIQLADAMDVLAKKGKMAACEYEGMQFDTGDPAGFLKANVYYGLKSYGDELEPFLRKMISCHCE